MLLELSTYLDNHWDMLELPQGRDGNLSFFKVAGNSWEEGRINFLVFDEKKCEPLLFVKMMREESKNASIKREYATMQKIAARDELAVFLPLPIEHIKIAGHDVIIQRACHGRRLITSMSRSSFLYFQKDTVRDNFKKALKFVVPFNKYMKNSLDAASFREAITEPLLSFYSSFEPSDSKKARLASILEGVEKEMGGKSFVVPAHGDYSATNIFVEPDDRITVIDWETAMEESLPFLDLFYFMSKYIHNLKVRPKDRWRRVREAYFGNNWFSELIRETVQEYCRLTGLDIELGRAVFPLHFFIKAKIKYGMKGKAPSQLWMNLFEFSVNNSDRCCF